MRRSPPGAFNTVVRRHAREREAFARSLVPMLAGIAAAGVCANREQAELLGALGIPSERGGAWTYQAVASVKHRLAAQVALPRWPGRPPRSGLTKRRF